MQTVTETTESAILAKTKELCETILAQPEFQAIRRKIDTFSNNEQATAQYAELSEKGEYLHHKQHQGLPLDGEEVNAFENLRQSFFQNPVAKDFVEAQNEMQKIEETVTNYVHKTFELGRIPSSEDFAGGSCGTGCGCH